MSEKPADGLERAEKASSLVRNVVIIIGGIVSVVLFIANLLGGKVEVRLDGIVIGGSKFLITDVDRFGELTRTLGKTIEQSKPKLGEQETGNSEAIAAMPIDGYQSQIGRLDAATIVRISNTSKKPVHLVVKVKHIKDVNIDPVDVDKGAFMRARFALVDVFSACPLQDKPMTVGDGGFIWPDATGTIDIKEFPVGCALRVEIVHARAESVMFTVFADGKLIRYKTPYKVYGPIGRYAALVVADPPWSYLFLIVLPLVLFATAVLAIASLIAKGRKASSIALTPADS